MLCLCIIANTLDINGKLVSNDFNKIKMSKKENVIDFSFLCYLFFFFNFSRKQQANPKYIILQNLQYQLSECGKNAGMLYFPTPRFLFFLKPRSFPILPHCEML